MQCVRHHWLEQSAGFLVDRGRGEGAFSSSPPSPAWSLLPHPHMWSPWSVSLQSFLFLTERDSFTENTSLSFAIIEFSFLSFQILNFFSLVRERFCFSCSRFLSVNSLLARRKGRSRALWGAVRKSRCSPSMVPPSLRVAPEHCICKEGGRELLSTPGLYLHFIRHPVGWFACRPSSLTSLSVKPSLADRKTQGCSKREGVKGNQEMQLTQ